MLTPQQIEEVSFNRATFGGYDMQSVDEFLVPLTEDYVTLYKENALLKSKMRVLVTKLEEYRNNEASMKEAMANTQKACDQMVLETEEKCSQMVKNASVEAAETAQNADAIIAAENERVEDARRAAAEKILALEAQLRTCLDILDAIRQEHRPAEVVRHDPAIDAMEEEAKTEALADEISHSLEALVGTTEDTEAKAEPQHPTAEETTSRFANLQFGRNYDPN